MPAVPSGAAAAQATFVLGPTGSGSATGWSGSDGNAQEARDATRSKDGPARADVPNEAGIAARTDGATAPWVDTARPVTVGGVATASVRSIADKPTATAERAASHQEHTSDLQLACHATNLHRRARGAKMTS